MDTPADRVRRFGSVAWAVIGILLLGWALLRLLGLFRPVVPSLLMAILIFVVLNPAVSRLEQKGLGRHLGTGLCFLLLAGLLAGAAYLLVPVVIAQTRAFLNQLPSLLAAYELELGGATGQTLEELMGRVEAWARDTDQVLAAGRQVFAFAGSVLTSAASLLLGAVIAFYAVADYPRLRAAGRAVLPPRARPVLDRLLEETLDATTEFMRVRLLLAVVVGSLGTVGFLLIGLPYWLLLGVVLGAANIIPILGTYIGSLPALLVAWLTVGPMGVVWTLMVLIIANGVDGYLLTPLLMHHHLDVHPIAVILAVVIGGAWYGVWGVLFAIPVLAAARSFVGEYLRLRGYLGRPSAGEEGEGLPYPLEEAARG